MSSSTTKEYTPQKGLPKKTESICPECGKILVAEYYDKEGKVYAKKTCPEHGEFDSLIWSDTEIYLRSEKFATDGIGLINPKRDGEDNVHIKIDGRRVDMHSSTSLANIDLTNRCNMNCPICFANANQAGYVYEPSYDEIVAMMQVLRNEEPIKCTAVQFSGGEPTIHPDFVRVIAKAKELRFAQIQVATNGLVFAKNPEVLKAAVEAGLNTVYLSFDGVSDDVYVQARDRKMFNVKLKVLENIRQLEHKPSVVLVPTIVKGVNDHQIGDIVKFAFDNADIVRGVNFQPVAFTGRITKEELEKGRFTLPDLVNSVNEQTGYTTKDDWYPVPVVAPISKFASILMGDRKITFTTHPHCGLATYLFKDENDNVIPLPRFIDVEKFVLGLDKLANKADKSRFKKYYIFKAYRLMNKCIYDDKVPEGLSKKTFLKVMGNIMSKKSKKTLAVFSWKMMFIGGMHFQDSYNYDIERVERCAIHYVTPDLRVIPFCAFNSGPEYRKEVEAKFSVPLAEWKEKNKAEAKALEEAMIVPDDQKPDV
ncbi:MAG: radical SAM protein [Thermoplasmatales archaeon]|nr:radical SAM protein [Thermoplasmatales archaeon]